MPELTHPKIIKCYKKAWIPDKCKVLSRSYKQYEILPTVIMKYKRSQSKDFKKFCSKRLKMSWLEHLYLNISLWLTIIDHMIKIISSRCEFTPRNNFVVSNIFTGECYHQWKFRKIKSFLLEMNVPSPRLEYMCMLCSAFNTWNNCSSWDYFLLRK